MLRVIRRAEPHDLPHVERLLRDAALPTAGVAAHFPSFVAMELDAEVVAAGGLELYGDVALLRSVVVRERERGRGLGQMVTRHLLGDASRRGVRSVYLLTTTAEDFFPRLGFSRIERAALPVALSASEELRGACPASAIALVHVVRRSP